MRHLHEQPRQQLARQLGSPQRHTPLAADGDVDDAHDGHGDGQRRHQARVEEGAQHLAGSGQGREPGVSQLPQGT
jgi:hypothetical protein